MSQTLFLFISALGLLAAVGTILARNLVYAALYLVGFFFVVACQFVLLDAEFLAAVQVLVYIGAVAILLMFGIMLTRNIQGDESTSLNSPWTLPALAAGLALFVLLCFGINNHVGLRGRTEWSAQQLRPALVTEPGQVGSSRGIAANDMGKAVGIEMLTRFVVPFEIAGLLLTAALVGAIALAHREHDDDSPDLEARGGLERSRPDSNTDQPGLSPLGSLSSTAE
ncbi:NADH-quinone oxidoreductase subunit J [Singulisphaera sp. PoT]|uniref:NADH-quinone oxidoreductase subunit J family protein n=1 Tax=Singulisphaera sp. PoT TaxID=3411797 RepID=UPI003BF5DBCA